MEDGLMAETVCAALVETTVFLSFFKDMPDHRQPGKVIYPLEEILLLCLLAVLAGAGAFTDIARFGEKKLTLLRRFRPFANGTPAHDHLGDILATLDAEAFRRCFVAWVSTLVKTPAEVIAIDGKTSRRSGSSEKLTTEGVCISCCVSEGAKFDLEAELGDLGSQALGFDLGGAAVEVVGAEILVVGAVLQHVVDCGEHGGGDRADRFFRAVLAAQTVELCFVVAVLLARRSPGALYQHGLEPGGAFAQPRRLAFAGAFVLPRTQAGPGQQMAGGWEAPHIGADFGEDGRRRQLADTRDRG